MKRLFSMRCTAQSKRTIRPQTQPKFGYEIGRRKRREKYPAKCSEKSRYLSAGKY